MRKLINLELELRYKWTGTTEIEAYTDQLTDSIAHP